MSKPRATLVAGVSPLNADQRGTPLLQDLGPLEPIRDPFLREFLGQFRLDLEKLLRAKSDQQILKAVKTLCELSRKILLRVLPARETPKDLVDEAIGLLQKAVQHIPEGDSRTVELRDNIRQRAEEMEKSLETSLRV